MQWYENGSATDYLAKKNANADRLQLVRLYSSSLYPIAKIMVGNFFPWQVLDVARGLAYLHTLNPGPIVHADLKGVCSSISTFNFSSNTVPRSILIIFNSIRVH